MGRFMDWIRKDRNYDVEYNWYMCYDGWEVLHEDGSPFPDWEKADVCAAQRVEYASQDGSLRLAIHVLMAKIFMWEIVSGGMTWTNASEQRGAYVRDYYKDHIQYFSEDEQSLIDYIVDGDYPYVFMANNGFNDCTRDMIDFAQNDIRDEIDQYELEQAISGIPRNPRNIHAWNMTRGLDPQMGNGKFTGGAFGAPW